MKEFPSKDELEVAEILQQLEELMLERERRHGVVRWGERRRRSGQEAYCSPSSTSPPPPTPAPPNFPSDVGDKTAAQNSPTTPLSFSPSFAYDCVMKNSCSPAKTSLPPLINGNRYKKWVMKETQKIDSLTTENESLKQLLVDEKSSRSKLKNINQQLRQLKSQMETMGLQERKPIDLHNPLESPHHPVTAAAISPTYTSAKMAVRRPMLPDLNAIIEDDEKDEMARAAMFAEARKLRKEIQFEKKKNNSSNNNKNGCCDNVGDQKLYRSLQRQLR